MSLVTPCHRPAPLDLGPAPRRTFARTARPRPIAAGRLVMAAGLLAAAGGAAANVPEKRTEGRYFVELSEIFLTTHDFDVVVAQARESAGAPPREVVAKIPRAEADVPKLTIGLNRPSGKTTYSFSYLTLFRKDEARPPVFRDRGAVIDPYLLPPGIAFRRQALRPNDVETAGHVPNWGAVQGYRRAFKFKVADAAFEHAAYENERFRLRWKAGLRYAAFDEELVQVVSYAEETARASATRVTDTTEAQDFFFASARVGTRAFGPLGGFSTRYLLGARKRWSLEGEIDAALLPERATASYALGLFDSSSGGVAISVPGGGVIYLRRPSSPLMPGVSPPYTLPFSGSTTQGGFRDVTWLLTGRAGFRYQANRLFSVGLDVWQARWHGLLSLMGVLDTVHREADFRVIVGDLNASDPQLLVSRSIIDVRRFDRRHDVVLDGVNLVLRFDF